MRGARSGRLRALLGALLGLIALACASEPPPAPRVAPPSPSLGARAAGILRRAIRRPTVNPPGDERPLARDLVVLLREAGLEAALVETPPGTSERGRAAAWGRLRGSGERRPIVLLSHLDVVPADAAEWEHDPFGGEVEDGFVNGRGALDAKGVAVVHLLTLTELARRGISLSRDVIFLATPDEETGGLDGAGYLAREHPELLGDAEYLLTEGGSIRPGRRGTEWGVAVTEKSPCWLRVVARGSPGHSSVPPEDAAAPRLVAALERVLRMERPVRVVPSVARMFAAMAPRASSQDAEGLADLAHGLASDPDFRRRFLANRGWAARVRDTIALTVLEGSPRTNVVSAEAAAHIDARLLPGQSCDRFADEVRRTVADPEIRVEILLSFPSRESPIDTPLYRAIERVAAETDSEALVIPRVVAGFTDAHYFRDLGITSYGFVPRWLPASESITVHGPGERVSVENLVRGVETQIAILKALDASE